jgi:membrane fusion protein (multidrug efflux system)
VFPLGLRSALVLVAGLLLASCSLVGDGAGSGAGKSGPGGGEKGAAKGGGRTPSVVVGAPATARLVDRIEAVGTAIANEQADLNSTVTERISRVNFGDGAFVPKGAVIAELVRSEQGAQLAQFEARKREAELQLERVQALMKQGFATRAQLDTAQAALDVARGQVDAARSQIGDRVIRAPFAGWLSLRRISPGAVVNAGTTIATIVDYSRIKLDFAVPEGFLGSISKGMPIEARAAAFEGRVFTGTVASVDPLVDPVTRSATVRAMLPNPDLDLRPGMLMTVEVQARPRDALVVPELALVGQGSQRFVYRVDSEDRAVRQEVVTGARRDGMVEIVSGLAPDARIIVEGTVKVRDGMEVKPVPAAQLAAVAQAEPASGNAARTTQ